MSSSHPIIFQGHYHSFQNTNTPDMDIERDSSIIGAPLVEGIQLKFNLSTMIISALVFLAILAWFDFMQTTFYTWLQPDIMKEEISAANKFYYAILATIVVTICSVLIIIYRKKLQI